MSWPFYIDSFPIDSQHFYLNTVFHDESQGCERKSSQQNLHHAGPDNSRPFSSLCVSRGRCPRLYSLILPIMQPKTVLFAMVRLRLSRLIVWISRTFPPRVTGRRWALESVTILPLLRSWTCSRRLGAMLDFSTLLPWVRSRYASIMIRLCWASVWLASKSKLWLPSYRPRLWLQYFFGAHVYLFSSIITLLSIQTFKRYLKVF
jgi:hypothetical protein